MLVLSRKEGQEIVVGESIRIRVTKLSGNRVRLGIEAPKGVTIRRSEIPRRERSDEWSLDEDVFRQSCMVS